MKSEPSGGVLMRSPGVVLPANLLPSPHLWARGFKHMNSDLCNYRTCTSAFVSRPACYAQPSLQSQFRQHAVTPGAHMWQFGSNNQQRFSVTALCLLRTLERNQRCHTYSVCSGAGATQTALRSPAAFKRKSRNLTPNPEQKSRTS